MILVLIQMKVSAKKRKELTQTIASLLGAIRAETGCGRCDFFRGMDDENTFCFIEEWDTSNNFESHRQSECFKVMRGVMALLAEPCEILCYRTLYKAEEKEAGL